MRNYSFEELMAIDQMLLQLAMYETAQGKMLVPNTQEELATFQRESAKKFNYFKHMIRNGELTLGSLKGKVANRWGAVEQDKTDPEDMDKLIEDIENDNTFRENNEKTMSGLGQLIQELFGVKNQDVVFASSNLPLKETKTEQMRELKKIGNPFTTPDEKNNEKKKTKSKRANRPKKRKSDH